MINAMMQAQADWWNSFIKPSDPKELTPDEIEARKAQYRELIAPHIENPENLP